MKGMDAVITFIIGILIIACIAYIYFGLATASVSQGNVAVLEQLILSNECWGWTDQECNPNTLSMISAKDENGESVSLQHLCQERFGESKENFLKGCTCRCCPMDDMCIRGSE